MFSDEPSICDLSLACELTQLHAIGMESMLKEKYPSIHHWFYVNMMSIPAFKQVHDDGAAKVSYIVEALAKMNKSNL